MPTAAVIVQYRDGDPQHDGDEKDVREVEIHS
jgi:hypothetical protein